MKNTQTWYLCTVFAMEMLLQNTSNGIQIAVYQIAVQHKIRINLSDKQVHYLGQRMSDSDFNCELKVKF
jgi:hypothetical protein